MNTPATLIPQIVPIHAHTSPSTTIRQNAKNPAFITTQQLYEAVFENAFHPMYIGNGGEKMIRFNEKFYRLFGFSPAEIRNMKPVDFFETHDKEFVNFINRRKEKGIAKAEVTCIKKSGERFPCRISSVIYESDKGEKRSMNTLVNISPDLTARWNTFG